MRLRAVAPLPNRSYADLGDGVSDGMEASRVFAAMSFGEYKDSRAEELREQLKEYCKLDTEAMVKVHESLRNFVTGE